MDCYHCGEKVLTGNQFMLKILGESRTLCCPGCQSVAHTIIQAGLLSYYQYRTDYAQKADLIPDELKALTIYDNQDITQEFVSEENNTAKVMLSLENVSCAACAWLIEKHLLSQIGVIQISVNITTNRAQVCWDKNKIKLSTILKTIHQLGYKATPFEAHQQEAQYQKLMRQYLYKLGVAGIASMQVMMIAVALYFDLFDQMEPHFQHLLRWVSLIFATPVLLYAATPFYFNAWRSLKAKTLSMDVPVTIALLFAFFSSSYATVIQQGEVYFESVSMFSFFLLLGRYLELNAKYKAAAASSNLLTSLPQIAKLINGKIIAAKSLVVGMQINILPGETIAADGIIISGKTCVNEAMLTGESAPVFKQKMDSVYAGSINVDGNIVVEVSCLAKESMIAKIVRLQDDALMAKPKLVLLADKVAKLFIAAILLIAGFTWLYWSKAQPDHAFWIR